MCSHNLLSPSACCRLEVVLCPRFPMDVFNETAMRMHGRLPFFSLHPLCRRVSVRTRTAAKLLPWFNSVDLPDGAWLRLGIYLCPPSSPSCYVCPCWWISSVLICTFPSSVCLSVIGTHENVADVTDLVRGLHQLAFHLDL